VDLARALADTLRTLRREAGLTQAEMARALKVSRPTLTRLKSASQNVTLEPSVSCAGRCGASRAIYSRAEEADSCFLLRAAGGRISRHRAGAFGPPQDDFPA